MKKLNLVSPQTLDNTSDTSPTSAQSAQSVQLSQAPLDEKSAISQNQDSLGQLQVKPLRAEQDEVTMKKKQKKALAVLSIIAIVAGIGTGFGAHRLRLQQAASTQGEAPAQRVAGEVINKGDVFGMQDTETFKDTTQGYLEAGGINGEGSHRLLRPGGDSQTVYLTSTVTDLDLLVGMEVKVWGETYKGQKAGWLMDVGKVEVLEVEAEPPLEE